ncbi:2-C-methyl-D-erythritol 4-phosphate cytidylyltransferase [soil metagenome]
MGFDKLKAPLGGKPLIAHSIAAFQACDQVDQIVLVCAAERVAEFQAIAAEFSKVIHVVPGGKERVESVLCGVDAFQEPRPYFVAVHDGARPLIEPAAIAECYEAAREFGAAVSAEPVTDTLHRVNGEQLAIENVPRKNLWRMQTPQTMELDALESLLREVHETGGTTTDEMTLLIRAGGKPKVVENSSPNLKVTYPRDLELAELLFQRRNS